MRTCGRFNVIAAGRDDFADLGRLRRFVSECGTVVHLAGMNRGDESEIERVNVDLARRLVEALDETGARPQVVFASSTHVDRDTAYGRSKRAAAALFEKWAGKSGGTFTNLVLPHVFGEGGRPFYNSVVSTFCYQLAKGDEPRIDLDGELNLMHAQDVAQLCLDAIDEPGMGERRPDGIPIRVSELLELLKTQSCTYSTGVIPAFRDPLELRLFNTFRSYLYPDRFPWPVTVHSDRRGSLFEGVKTLHGGQAFVSTTKPGITRGEHFHMQKVERFLVLSGTAVIRLRKLLGVDVLEFPVTGNQPAFVDIPTMYAHNVTNVGTDDLVTLFWSHEIFDPDAPDTYAEAVRLEESHE